MLASLLMIHIMFCFVHPIFHFWFLVTVGNEVTKILSNLCLHFARQDGQDRKKRKKNHATKVTKNQKTKIWDERNESGVKSESEFISERS